MSDILGAARSLPDDPKTKRQFPSYVDTRTGHLLSVTSCVDESKVEAKALRYKLFFLKALLK